VEKSRYHVLFASHLLTVLFLIHPLANQDEKPYAQVLWEYVQKRVLCKPSYGASLPISSGGTTSTSPNASRREVARSKNATREDCRPRKGDS